MVYIKVVGRRTNGLKPTPPTHFDMSSTTWYYAVAVGRRIGVYCSWSEAAPQVSGRLYYVIPDHPLAREPQWSVGFPGSMHQKFRTWEEAVQFIARVQEQGPSQPLYAVRKGRQPGIYADWGACKSQVYSLLYTYPQGIGYPCSPSCVEYSGPEYKKFFNIHQAQLWMQG
jgi:viroplasmin and RNaseH domain-containing protein